MFHIWKKNCYIVLEYIQNFCTSWKASAEQWVQQGVYVLSLLLQITFIRTGGLPTFKQQTKRMHVFVCGHELILFYGVFTYIPHIVVWFSVKANIDFYLITFLSLLFFSHSEYFHSVLVLLFMFQLIWPTIVIICFHTIASTFWYSILSVIIFILFFCFFLSEKAVFI